MINIAEILDKCTKGTKLYSPIFGDVYLEKIRPHLAVIVKRNKDGKNLEEFLYDGRYTLNGECMLFPSKDNRDWNTFQIPFRDGDIVFYNNTIAMFKEWGDDTLFRTYCVFYPNVSDIFSFEVDRPLFGKGVRKEIRLATEDEKKMLFDAIKTKGYKWNVETKTLEKIIVPKFKVGDEIVRKNSISNSFIVNSVSSDYYGLVLPDRTGIGVLNVSEQDEWDVLPNTKLKFKAGDKIVKKDNPTECWYVQGIDIYDNSFYFIVANGKLANLPLNDQDKWELAPVPKFKVGDIVETKRNKLFDYKIIKITDTHYTLESIPGANTYDILICEDENWKLVPNKFDISTLKPFDKVLVRDSNESRWCADMFSHYSGHDRYPFCTLGSSISGFSQCIPYEGNEHLLGTTNDCGEYYKNW